MLSAFLLFKFIVIISVWRYKCLSSSKKKVHRTTVILLLLKRNNDNYSVLHEKRKGFRMDEINWRGSWNGTHRWVNHGIFKKG